MLEVLSESRIFIQACSKLDASVDELCSGLQRSVCIKKKIKKVLQLVKYYTLGVKNLYVPKEISHEEL